MKNDIKTNHKAYHNIQYYPTFTLNVQGDDGIPGGNGAKGEPGDLGVKGEKGVSERGDDGPRGHRGDPGPPGRKGGYGGGNFLLWCYSTLLFYHSAQRDFRRD